MKIFNILTSATLTMQQNTRKDSMHSRIPNWKIDSMVFNDRNEYPATSLDVFIENRGINLRVFTIRVRKKKYTPTAQLYPIMFTERLDLYCRTLTLGKYISCFVCHSNVQSPLKLVYRIIFYASCCKSLACLFKLWEGIYTANKIFLPRNRWYRFVLDY